MKKLVILLLIGAICLFSVPAGAGKLFQTEKIEEEGIDFANYVKSGVDYVFEVLSRLVESGKPAVLFYEETKIGIEGVLFENFLVKNLDLVGGLTFAISSENGTEGIPKDWKDRLYGGIEYEIPTSTGQGIFSRLKIGLYSSKEGSCVGLGFELRPAG